MAVTDKQVQQARDKVDRLRAQVEEARNDAVVRVQDSANEVRKARLDEEADRLAAELKAIKATQSDKAVDSTVETTVEQIEQGGGEPEPSPAAQVDTDADEKGK